MFPTLKRALEAIGLNKNEVTGLLVLLEHGPMLVATAAKAADLNRSTTYGVLKLLAEKGLVSSFKKSGAVRYQSIPPKQLPAYIERRREMLAETKEQVTSLVSQLELLRSKGKTLPKVQFFEGEEGVKQAYEDTIENNKGKTLRDITGVDAVFHRLGEEWVQYYLKKRVQAGISCTDLAPESDWARKVKADEQKYLLTMKFLPAEAAFDGEVDIYDNKVAIFSYAQENPIALIIEDGTVSDMMKKLFDCLEKTAK